MPNFVPFLSYMEKYDNKKVVN